jgi:hypothetical protein
MPQPTKPLSTPHSLSGVNEICVFYSTIFMLITVHCSYSQYTLYQQTTSECNSDQKNIRTSRAEMSVTPTYSAANWTQLNANHDQLVDTLNAFIDLNSCCTWWLASSCESYYCSSIPGQVNVLGGLDCQTSTAETSTLLLTLQHEQQTHKTSTNKTGNHNYQRGL